MEFQEFAIEYEPEFKPAFQSESKVTTAPWFLAGLAIGAAATYFLDPERGRYRRSIVRDKAVRLSHDLSWYSDKQGKNIANRIWGLVSQVTSLFESPSPVDNETLAQRVKSKIGRMLTHPKS